MILIDGDPLVYRIGFAIEHDKMGMVAGRYNLEKCLSRILAELVPHYGGRYQIYLGGKNNFRQKRAQLLPYKGNRAITGRPRLYNEMRDCLINEWGAQVVDGMEADDKLGIELTKHYQESAHLGDTGFCTAVCVSIDKDLLMIPGIHYNFVKKVYTYVDHISGYVHFSKQMLTGDATDNIPGLRGVSDVTAKKLLAYDIPHDKPISNVELFRMLDNKVFDIYKSKVKDGKLKLKNKLEIEIKSDDDIKLILAELRDLLWIKRYED